MFPTDINAVDERWLIQACADGMPESSRLDVKRLLPAADDRGRAEFLKDVTAFANADGGDLVYGVNEAEGRMHEPAAITSEPADAAQRRLQQTAEASIEPRVAGLHMRVVAIAGGYVLVIRVPASFDAPHRYAVGSGWRFVARARTLTVDLTYEQIRAAFDRTSSLIERCRRFRKLRVDMIADRRLPHAVVDGPFAVLHFIPLAAMAGRTTIELSRVYHEHFARFAGEGWGGASRAFNLDGVLAFPGRRPPYAAYAQTFRTGAFELARSVGRNRDGLLVIPATSLAVFMRDSMRATMTVARNLGISGPAIAGGSLIGALRYSLGLGGRYDEMLAPAPDRDRLVLPEAWVEHADDANVDVIVRPMLDVLWQAFDEERCLEYTEAGEWRPR